MKVLEHGCVNAVLSRRSVSEIFVDGSFEFIFSYGKVYTRGVLLKEGRMILGHFRFGFCEIKRSLCS